MYDAIALFYKYPFHILNLKVLLYRRMEVLISCLFGNDDRRTNQPTDQQKKQTNHQMCMGVHNKVTLSNIGQARTKNRNDSDQGVGGGPGG